MADDPVEVRPPIEAELEAVTALLVAQLREHQVQTPEAKIARAVRELFRRPERGRLLIAVEGGRPVGLAALSFAWPLEHAERSAWLEELYVDPPARGRGIGTRLLRATLRVAAGAGATLVDLEVQADHQRAAGLYAREGFRVLARTHWVRSLEPVNEAPSLRRPTEITGGCFCGAVRYRVSGSPNEVTHCHCGICRRTSGAPVVTWATFPATSFLFTVGTPAEFQATSRALRQLCSTCGTALTFRATARPHVVDVTVGSMDRPDVMIPAAHVWTSGQLAWLQLADDLPRHPEDGPDEPETDP